jgi:hypothetical protein
MLASWAFLPLEPLHLPIFDFLIDNSIISSSEEAKREYAFGLSYVQSFILSCSTESLTENKTLSWIKILKGSFQS